MAPSFVTPITELRRRSGYISLKCFSKRGRDHPMTQDYAKQGGTELKQDELIAQELANVSSGLRFDFKLVDVKTHQLVAR